jgi:hypothetical protein
MRPVTMEVSVEADAILNRLIRLERVEDSHEQFDKNIARRLTSLKTNRVLDRTVVLYEARVINPKTEPTHDWLPRISQLRRCVPSHNRRPL